MELEYDIISKKLIINKNMFMNNNNNLILGAWDWCYKLTSRIDSPNVFRFLVNDDQNALEFNSYIKFGKYSLDEEHTLKIYSSEDVTDSYEFKWLTNYENTGWILYIFKMYIRCILLKKILFCSIQVCI